MRLAHWNCKLMLTSAVASVLVLAGCGKTDSGPKAGAKKDKNAAKGTEVAAKTDGHDHGDWWCAEHGVPEDVCAQCNPKLVAEFKKKGDWCDKHDRPDSQCFVCHPELKGKFAAMYRAKYGKEPPPMEEETKKDEGKKNDDKKQGSKK